MRTPPHTQGQGAGLALTASSLRQPSAATFLVSSSSVSAATGRQGHIWEKQKWAKPSRAAPSPVSMGTPRYVPGDQSTRGTTVARSEGVSPQSRESLDTTPPPRRSCPGSPAAHLLRRMILNSELCRLVTDTYGSSNSCSFRTTAGNSSSAAAQCWGSPPGPHHPAQGHLLQAQDSRSGARCCSPPPQGRWPTQPLWGFPQRALLTGESSILCLSH